MLEVLLKAKDNFMVHTFRSGVVITWQWIVGTLG